MFADLGCTCQAHLQLDSEDDAESVWSLVWRFANRHVDCGYVTGGTPPAQVARPRQDDSTGTRGGT